MPIKDPIKRREYQKELMKKRRNGLTDKNVSPVLDPNLGVSPVSPSLVVSPKLDPGLTVRPENKMLDPHVSPDNSVSPKMLDPVSPCPNCSKLKEQIQALQQPINPTIERWKTDYFKLEKEFHEKGAEQNETIKRLKEKLRELTTEKQSLIEKYSNLENQPKNTDNSLSVPDLNHLIAKHKNYQNQQHFYTDKDRKEREFLKSLLDKLWIFN